MRQRNVRHSLDFLHLENAQIGLPLVEPIQLILIGIQVFRQRLRMNDSIGHSVQGDVIYDAPVNSKTDNPPLELILTTKTQYVRNISDSHRNRSKDNSESLA